MGLTIVAPAFVDNGEIPTLYTCEGEDVSPAARVVGRARRGTKSLALIVDDPDAPDPKAPKMTWVHWVLYDIPATATGLRRGGRAREPPGRHARGHQRLEAHRATAGPARRSAGTATSSSSTRSTRCWPTWAPATKAELERR